MYAFVVIEDPNREGTWHVEQHDSDGCITDDIADIRFEGKHAAQYAEDYASWKNGQTKMKNTGMRDKTPDMKMAS